MWTDEQLEKYNEQGFLFQPGLLSQQQIDDLQASTADLMNEKDNPEEVHIVREKGGPVRTVFWPLQIERGRGTRQANSWQRRLHFSQQAELQGIFRGQRVDVASRLRLLAIRRGG